MDYHYDDKDIANDKITYYRLKQVDIDGQFKYSKTVSVLKKGKNSTFFVYPNPAKNELIIEGYDEVKSVKIYTLQGVLVFIGNQKTINLSDFNAAMYILEIENTVQRTPFGEGGISRIKFVKE